MRRYRVVVVDESHNLRNRLTQAHRAIDDYIDRNDSRVILLTATPYNKRFLDVANQIGLFVDDDHPLGIQPEAAMAALEKEPSRAYRMIALPMTYHELGQAAESNSALAALIEEYERDTAYNIASVYAFRSEADPAFAWLEKAVEYKDAGMSGIQTDSLFANDRADNPRRTARIQHIVNEINLLCFIFFSFYFLALIDCAISISCDMSLLPIKT